MSRGRRRAAVAGAGLMGLAVWLLRGLIPGLGGEPADSPKEVEVPPVSSAPALEIVARGEECTLNGTTQPCEALCAQVDAQVASVRIDGTHGAHGAVIGLRDCLRAKGVKDVEARNR